MVILFIHVVILWQLYQILWLKSLRHFTKHFFLPCGENSPQKNIAFNVFRKTSHFLVIGVSFKDLGCNQNDHHPK
jgi:hypothetical protein